MGVVMLENADLSTALRFGQDDKSVAWPRSLTRDLGTGICGVVGIAGPSTPLRSLGITLLAGR